MRSAISRRLPPWLYRFANQIRTFYWFVARPTRFGVKVLVTNGNRVLLVKHSYEELWNLPGGGFRPRGESAEEAGRREARQEIGLSLGSLELLGNYESDREYKRDTVYCLHSESAYEPRKTSGEISEWSWFEQDNIPEDASTAVRKAVALWSDRRHLQKPP